MKDELVRFGVAMEQSLLSDFDGLVEARGVTRSEALRDLVRAEVVRSRAEKGVPVVGTLTLVYEHHVRELTEHLNEFQHRLGDQVRATLHIHLDAERCLEVIVLRGRSDELQRVAEQLLATRGVTHGRLEIVTDEARAAAPHRHGRGHAHTHHHEPPRRRPRAG
ncbi:MAG TPA: nickel-responsive transcriptional regulator NikR [Polyangiaceae bacterium]|nr:nickel-responsive transcriptional regulator NikR [Polyangiaceae bacterium]